jgi:hypothetical protein
LPRNVDDTDFVNLENIINAAAPKLFPKILKHLENETGNKMRKINKRQCQVLHELFCGADYSKFATLNKKNNDGDGDMDLD